MGRAYEKRIKRAQEVQAAVGQRPERTEPRTRAEVASFVAGFALSAAAQRQIVDEWVADAGRSWNAGYAQCGQEEHEHGY